MADEETLWYAPGHRATHLGRQAARGELLFEFHVESTKKFYRRELRDHGEHGIEAVILDPVELVMSRMFSTRLDRTRTPRAMAITWAKEERKAIEGEGW